MIVEPAECFDLSWEIINTDLVDLRGVLGVG